MSSVVLNIGGFSLAVEGGYAERVLKRSNAVRPFLAGTTEHVWTVRYGMDVAPLANSEIVSRFRYEENEGDCAFSCQGQQYCFSITSVSGELLVRMSYSLGSNVVEATQCDDVSALRFSLWFAYSLLSAFSHTTFVHSSTVVCRDRAVLFLGESGTGKSTHSRMWLNSIEDVSLLNDDSPIISTVGKPMVYGTPWSGKTPCYHNASYPIAAVVRLSQAPFNAIRRLSVPEAFAALQPSLPPALMQSEPLADQLIDIISRIIGVVPVYHLQCLPNADAARLCFTTIFGEKSAVQ